MKPKNEIISVGLYLYGDNLDPEIVSKKLGIKPSEAHHKNDIKITSTNREYATKTGVWSLIAESKSLILSDVIEQLTDKVKLDDATLQDIEGVQETKLDVFIAGDSDEYGEGTFEFEISKDNMKEINRLGLSLGFTVTLVNEKAIYKKKEAISD